MPRPTGSRNRDYDASRTALARALAPALLDASGDPNTLKGLAAAAGVSVPTLRHYFGDREDVFAAVLETVRADSVGHLERMADPRDADPAELIPELLVTTTAVWRRYGLGRLFASGLSLGLEHATRGPSFLDELLEPFLQAAERLLAGLVAAGRLPELDPRATALSLLAPVLVALLHQDNLGGVRCRPLDVEAYARTHADLVLAGLGARPGGTGRQDGGDR